MIGTGTSTYPACHHKMKPGFLPAFLNLSLLHSTLLSIQPPKQPYLSTILYCYLHMYGTLTNPELLCRLSDCCIMFNNIFGDFYGSFFYITLQGFFPCDTFFTLYAGKGFCILNLFRIPNYESCTVGLFIHNLKIFIRNRVGEISHK